MRLFFIRHGQAEHNLKFKINESNQNASNLTTQGVKEVQESAVQLKKLVKLDIIYCSPLVRCRQTAKLVNQAYNNKIPIKINKQLSELKTGFHNRSMLIWSISLFLSRKRLTKKFKKGQSIAEAATEAGNFYDYLQDKHLGENVLIVAHWHNFQMLCHHLYDKTLTVPWHQDMHLATGELHEFRSKSSKA